MPPESAASDDLLIRGYTSDDWPAVCRIHDAARKQELTWGGLDPNVFRPMTEAASGDEFFESETLVACLEDQLVGFASWNGDYLTWLYVDPDWQRRGIGRKLLQTALSRMGPEAWTNTVAGNEAALALYLQAGMEVVWQRPSIVEGYPCEGLRLALPTSRMRDHAAKRVRRAH